jgi:putative (di)nucleoside polyphosphate hydrolase
MSDKASLPYRPCVGVMLVNSQGQVFVGKRIDTIAEAWQMPQGGIDDGESHEACALRELYEETGVAADKVNIVAKTDEWLNYDLPDHLVGKVWGGKYRGQTQIWFLMRFLGIDGDINLETHHPEFESWKWMDPESLPEVIVPFKQDLYREVLKAFQGLY